MANQQPPRKRARETTEPVSRQRSGRHKHFVDRPEDLFRALFHDEHRQKEARLAGMLYTSAAGEAYQKYERLVWNEMKVHHHFQLGPDALKKRIPKLQELDTGSFNELWKQYKRHCDYENLASMQANALIDALEGSQKQLIQTTRTAKDLECELQAAREEAQGYKTQLEAREKQLLQQTEATTLLENQRDAAKAALSDATAELTSTQARASEDAAQAAKELSDLMARHNDELAEQKATMEQRLARLDDEKKKLEAAVVVEQDKLNVKATNSNRIYEENIILEKQLQAKMERTDQLAEENMMLKAQLRAAMTQQMAEQNMTNLLACNSKRPLQIRNSPTKAEHEPVKSRELLQAHAKMSNDSAAKVSAFQKLMSLIKD